MTPDDVRRKVNDVRRLMDATDRVPGRQYMEGVVMRLWQDVLQAIAAGAAEPDRLAYEALKTSGIHLGPVGT